MEVGAAGGVESAQKELGQKLFGEEGEEEGEEEAEEAPAEREEEIKDDEEEMDDFIDYADGEKPRPRAQVCPPVHAHPDHEHGQRRDVARVERLHVRAEERRLR